MKKLTNKLLLAMTMLFIAVGSSRVKAYMHKFCDSQTEVIKFLPALEQEELNRFCGYLSNIDCGRNSADDVFLELLSKIEIYANNKNEAIKNRINYIIGYCRINENKALINVKHLCKALGKCKSSINKRLLNMGYIKYPMGSSDADYIKRFISNCNILNYYSLTRQWTIRTKNNENTIVKSPSLPVIIPVPDIDIAPAPEVLTPSIPKSASQTIISEGTPVEVPKVDTIQPEISKPENTIEWNFEYIEQPEVSKSENTMEQNFDYTAQPEVSKSENTMEHNFDYDPFDNPFYDPSYDPFFDPYNDSQDTY